MTIEPEKWIDRRFRFDLPPERYENVLERFRGTPPRAAALVAGASDEALTTRVDGSWSAQEHIAHLDDLHELDEKRLAEYLAGAQVLSPADVGNALTEAGHHNEASIAEILDRFRRHRGSLVEKLEAVPESAIAASCRHARLGQELRLIDWVYFMAEHDDHHLARARRALRRWGRRS